MIDKIVTKIVVTNAMQIELGICVDAFDDILMLCPLRSSRIKSINWNEKQRKKNIKLLNIWNFDGLKFHFESSESTNRKDRHD